MGQLNLANACPETKIGPNVRIVQGISNIYVWFGRTGCLCFLMMQWAVLPCNGIAPMGVQTTLYVSVKCTEACFIGCFLETLWYPKEQLTSCWDFSWICTSNLERNELVADTNCKLSKCSYLCFLIKLTLKVSWFVCTQMSLKATELKRH